ncbi:hypothetical protein KHC28_11390 [Ancylobacter sonchi]|uniref:helix-turn-helix domain-containing protein n=1 Tax=Ancylobacter sonchi TaxID=1937790 RepID=UPI001BD6C88D|nr:helix-turn-helix domain-containing protein [Ancylobacter sonchi]MBS7534262.1 hypothetical protein [Ancylobacter sonchi]
MADIATRFRVLLAERQADYRANLQFCCDHYRSVSDVCRRLKINRQQFNRYLGGTAVPSRHNHKRICDFFGLEEDELFTPHEAFAASFKRRVGSQPAMSDTSLALLQKLTGGDAEALAEYQGFYFRYFYTYLGVERIKRELVHWRFEKGTFLSTVKQRYLGDDETGDPSSLFITYRGIVSSLGDRLVTIDYHRDSDREVSMTIFYPKGRILKRLDGVMVGVSHGSGRSIGAARVVMEFLGTEIDIRAALNRLGTFELDEASIPAAIKKAVRNEMRPGETLFLART